MRQSRQRLREQARDLVAVAADHLGGPEHVVETDEDVGDEEAALRQGRRRVGQRDRRLEACRVVVCEVADHGLAARLGLGEVAEVRAAADERVSPEPPALDGLQQERGASLPA